MKVLTKIGICMGFVVCMLSGIVANQSNGVDVYSRNVVISPGGTSSSLNLAWHSGKKGVPAVRIGQDKTGKKAMVFKGSQTLMAEGVYSNKVLVKGVLKTKTTYYYFYTDDVTKDSPVWSGVNRYRTENASDFQVIGFGDIQIGASSNLLRDTISWNATLEKALSVAPKAGLFLSVGDQVNVQIENNFNGTRQAQFEGLKTPSYMRNIPFAPTIGNHEARGGDYKEQFSLPNSSGNYGMTKAGGDYYFSKGNTLFLVLNGNSRDMKSHQAFMKKAISSNKGAKWRVATLHQDIYGSGTPHSNKDSANLRILFAPLMEQYNVDLCLSGHDHSYARSEFMVDGTAVHYGDKKAVNPKGTVYMALGTATGSKYYDIVDVPQYYVADRNGKRLPTFSVFSFTGNELNIRTFDIKGAMYGKEFTIVKTVGKSNLVGKIAEAGKLKAKYYTKATFQKMISSYTKVKNLLKLTSPDKGYTKIVSCYQTKVDLLTIYNTPIKAYQNSKEKHRFKTGFSTLLDKTMVTNLKISGSQLDQYYAALAKAKGKLKKR